MTVQNLIDALQQVFDKRQIVTVCGLGVEASETCIVSVESEVPDKHNDPETIGVCWLLLPEKSVIHED